LVASIHTCTQKIIMTAQYTGRTISKKVPVYQHIYKRRSHRRRKKG
jgi:hypothetical protein